MSLANGDDAVLGNRLAYQQYNRLKNHFRAAAAPSNIQPGMIFSDSDDDRLHHAGAGTGNPTDEVLQETRSHEAEPVFKHLYLDLDTASVSDPPTQAELETEFGATPGAGFQALLKNTSSGSGKLYRIVNDGTYYYATEYTKAL